MCVNGHVSSSTGQALMLPVWNVFFGLRVDVLFGKTKVDDVDNVFLFIPLSSDEKVFRFYIPIDEVFRVHILHSRNLERKKNRVSEAKHETNLMNQITSQKNENQEAKLTDYGTFQCMHVIYTIELHGPLSQ